VERLLTNTIFSAVAVSIVATISSITAGAVAGINNTITLKKIGTVLFHSLRRHAATIALI
jgi:hypothetical protein